MGIATEQKINTLAYNQDLPTPTGTLSPRSVRNKGFTNLCYLFKENKYTKIDPYYILAVDEIVDN